LSSKGNFGLKNNLWHPKPNSTSKTNVGLKSKLWHQKKLWHKKQTSASKQTLISDIKFSIKNKHFDQKNHLALKN